MSRVSLSARARSLAEGRLPISRTWLRYLLPQPFVWETDRKQADSSHAGELRIRGTAVENDAKAVVPA